MIKKYGVNSKKNCFSEIYYYSSYTEYTIDKENKFDYKIKKKVI